MLDSYPFGGYTTTMETWAVGNAPVVTIPHMLMAGRCTYGFYKIMGIDDCIAENFEEYVEIAVRLGTDREFRNTVSERIGERSHLLWNRNATKAEWEQFMEEVVYKQPITNLHVNRPEAPIYNTGDPFPRA